MVSLIPALGYRCRYPPYAMEFTPESDIDDILAERYLAGFANSSFTETDRAMLSTHFAAPNQTVSAPQLARAVGFHRYSAANLHYGRLARKIGHSIGINPKYKLATLVTFAKPFGYWEWKLRPQAAFAIHELELCDDEFETNLPNEIGDPSYLTEGSAYRITVNTYERSSRARKLCLEHHGYACACCDMTFESTYGTEFAKIIHVHHLTPLSVVDATYVIDPLADLIPVCPNCHAAVHSKNPPYSIGEIRRLTRKDGG